MKQGTIWSTFIVAIVMIALMIFLPGAEQPAFAEAAGFDLAISVGAPEHVAPGAEYAVNVTYTNLGQADSPDTTQIVVTLPAGVTFVSAADQAGTNLPPSAVSGSQLSWNVGAIPAGDCKAHIWITLKVEADLPEETALAVSGEILPTLDDADPANNAASATSLVCDMAGSVKQVSAQVARPGDVLTYTIQLRLAQRNGMTSLQMRTVTLTDTLPGGNQVRFLGWSGPVSGEWDGQKLRWQGQVQAGEPLTLQYRVGVEGEIAPGTVITNAAHLGWGGKLLRLGPTTTMVEMPGNAAMIGRQGQAWQPDAGLTVTVPPEAVQETTRFEYRALFGGSQPESAPPGLIYAHRAFELNAFHFGELHQFGQPLTLQLKLGSQEVKGLKQNSLRLWYRNSAGEPWAQVGAPEWVTGDTLQVTTSHFTQFALFGTAEYQAMLPVIRR